MDSCFFFFLLILVILKKMLDNKFVQAVLQGLKPCITGIIISTGLFMILQNSVFPMFSHPSDFLAPIITVILSILFFGSKAIFKKKMSPIVLIAISAVLGIVVYGF